RPRGCACAARILERQCVPVDAPSHRPHRTAVYQVRDLAGQYGNRYVFRPRNGCHAPRSKGRRSRRQGRRRWDAVVNRRSDMKTLMENTKSRLIGSGLIATTVLILISTPAAAQNKPTIARFLSPGFPSDLVSAKKADRVAWLVYERGQRNVYTAAAPDFKPVRITKFPDDNGIVLSDLSISDDGAIVTFVRGSAPNREGWIANPNSDPNGAERAIWVARTSGTGAWRVIEGAAPSLSPDGHSVAF